MDSGLSMNHAFPVWRWRSRPVSRILFRPLRGGGGHPSWSRVAATLVQPTREHWAGHPLPAWPCSGWGLPSRPVTRPLVSSYLTVSPLPLPRATWRRAVGPGRWAVCSLWHFPRVAPPGRYPASCPVESGLSSTRGPYRPRAAAARPTRPTTKYRPRVLDSPLRRGYASARHQGEGRPDDSTAGGDRCCRGRSRRERGRRRCRPARKAAQFAVGGPSGERANEGRRASTSPTSSPTSAGQAHEAAPHRP